MSSQRGTASTNVRYGGYALLEQLNIARAKLDPQSSSQYLVGMDCLIYAGNASHGNASRKWFRKAEKAALKEFSEAVRCRTAMAAHTDPAFRFCAIESRHPKLLKRFEACVDATSLRAWRRGP